tara:strand:- start:528 stop:878 length:351 start_codon:yes stop_codon:yes gene_type:complete
MPLPAAAVTAAKVAGPTILSWVLGNRDRKKAQRKQDKRAAFAALQNRLSPGQGAGGSPQMTQPGLASQLAADPLVQKQVMDMIGKLGGSQQDSGGSRNLLQKLLGNGGGRFGKHNL